MMEPGAWKDPCGITPYIKFDINLMHLTPSSMARKFNRYIFKNTNFNLPSHGSVHSDRCQTSSSMSIKGVPIWVGDREAPPCGSHGKILCEPSMWTIFGAILGCNGGLGVKLFGKIHVGSPHASTLTPIPCMMHLTSSSMAHRFKSYVLKRKKLMSNWPHYYIDN